MTAADAEDLMAIDKKKRRSTRSSQPPPETDRGPATHQLTEDARADRRIEQLRISVASGPDAGISFESRGDRVVIGTHASCELVLTDPAVSRFHCDLVVANGRVLLSDLGSTNRTIVDGMDVVSVYPRSGSVIRVGQTDLHLEIGARRIALPISERERFGAMVGRSPAMRRVFAVLEKAAETEATILLQGETGTGKDLAAESIHMESARREGPFVVVDCGAIPAELLESELFGHERGAFTGATGRREGAFLAASGGTILIDEIGELPLDLQPKLLRVLERREVKRVGADTHSVVDVRVVAATNRDLRTEVNAKRFRPDLYYRLAVVEVRLPSLRERVDDVPLLAEQILARLEAPAERKAPLQQSDFVAALLQHPWSGNVRELRNYLERCLTLREHYPPEHRALDDALPVINTSGPFMDSRQAWIDYFERRYLEDLLARHGGNLVVAAREARIDRATLYRLLWRHGLR
jgi:two-component system response regulator GlrR